MQTKLYLSLLLIIGSSLFGASERLFAQSADLKLPNNTEAWANTPPITSDQLKGKAAILYFFEET